MINLLVLYNHKLGFGAYNGVIDSKSRYLFNSQLDSY
jgi:hypothetical protein